MPTAATIVVPLYSGMADGRSFTVTPFHPPFGTRGLRARWQRATLRGPVFRWLRDVTAATVKRPDDSKIAASFVQPLESLFKHSHVDDDLRARANAALRDLERGAWQPRSVLMHGDFWVGNLLTQLPTATMPSKFVVIDWRSSKLCGHAVYDLVRMAQSLGLSQRDFRAEALAHAAMLECSPQHLSHHLVSALGYLADHLGEWPLERFAHVAHSSVVHLDDACRAD